MRSSDEVGSGDDGEYNEQSCVALEICRVNVHSDSFIVVMSQVSSLTHFPIRRKRYFIELKNDLIFPCKEGGIDQGTASRRFPDTLFVETWPSFLFP